MPKRGFKSVVISEELYWKLVELSNKERVSLHELLRKRLLGETASGSEIQVDRLSDVGLDVIFTEDKKLRNALKVELDDTDHIDFKCERCNAPLLLVGFNYSDSVIEFHYICPVCLQRIYTKYNQPFSPTMLWKIISSEEWGSKAKSSRSKEEEEILKEIFKSKKVLADSIAKIIVKSAISSLDSYDLISFSDGSFEVPLRVDDTFKRVFTYFVEDVETSGWIPFNFKFIPYYSEHVGNVLKYKKDSLVIPGDIFIEILTDLLLADVLRDLKPSHTGRYVIFNFSLKYLPREILLPIATKRSPQRFLVLEPFLNLYREFRYCLCIENEDKKIKKILKTAQFEKIDKEKFLQIFDREQFDRSKKHVLAYLELVDKGIVFLEHVNEVYILVDERVYREFLEREEILSM